MGLKGCRVAKMNAQATGLLLAHLAILAVTLDTGQKAVQAIDSFVLKLLGAFVNFNKLTKSKRAF